MNSAVTTIKEHIQQAAASGQTLRIQGGNTKAFYGEQAQAHAVLDTRANHGVVSYEPSELVVTVRAGTPLKTLESLLLEQGQCLAYEPPHFGDDATVGGMVAAGLAGPSRANVGNVRDHVLGAKLINGLGQELTFGGQVMKNVAGYDVSRVLAGSMGTLGVITEVSLKVLPTAPAQATLACELSQQDALNQLHRWGAQALPLNASVWWHDVTHAKDMLYLRLRGALAAVEAACVRMVADVQTLGGAATRMDNIAAQTFWQDCREQTLSFFQAPSADACLWRLGLPQTTPVLQLPYPMLIEWHGATRWLWAPPSAASALRDLAAQAGGHATVFRRAANGLGQVPVFSPLPPVQQRIQRELQKQFDPHGVFNTARLGI
jgi:glycolate oxidase FAD binding subunit